MQSPSSQLKTITQRQSQASVLSLVALAIAAVLLFWFLVRPAMADLRDKRQTLSQQQQAFAKIDQEKQALVRLVARLHDSAKEVSQLDEALPLDSRLSRAELLIDNLVAQSGMKLADLNGKFDTGLTGDKDVSPSAAGNKSVLAKPYEASRKLQTIVIDVTATGSSDQCRALLKLIETNGRLLDVSALDVTTDKDGVTTYHLKIKAYVFAPTQ